MMSQNSLSCSRRLQIYYILLLTWFQNVTIAAVVAEFVCVWWNHHESHHMLPSPNWIYTSCLVFCCFNKSMEPHIERTCYSRSRIFRLIQSDPVLGSKPAVDWSPDTRCNSLLNTVYYKFHFVLSLLTRLCNTQCLHVSALWYKKIYILNIIKAILRFLPKPHLIKKGHLPK